MPVSDDTRERRIQELCGGLAAGRLGLDTFVRHVELVHEARTHDELAAALADLPPQPGVQRALDHLHPRRLLRRLGFVGPHAVPPPLLHPPATPLGGCLSIGRDVTCDFAIPDPTVSRRHAELQRTPEGWTIRDLTTRNGTRVNGWLVSAVPIEPGDWIAFGAHVMRFEPLPELEQG